MNLSMSLESETAHQDKRYVLSPVLTVSTRLKIPAMTTIFHVGDLDPEQYIPLSVRVHSGRKCISVSSSPKPPKKRLLPCTISTILLQHHISRPVATLMITSHGRKWTRTGHISGHKRALFVLYIILIWSPTWYCYAVVWFVG
jgi:hypothetical protein